MSNVVEVNRYTTTTETVDHKWTDPETSVSIRGRVIDGSVSIFFDDPLGSPTPEIQIPVRYLPQLVALADSIAAAPAE